MLGPVLIPLLRAGGLVRRQAGAVLLLGSSMGGELFNPGAVEMRKLAELTGISVAGGRASRGLNLADLLAVLADVLVAGGPARPPGDRDHRARTRPSEDEPAEPDVSTLNLVKAMVPLLPILCILA